MFNFPFVDVAKSTKSPVPSGILAYTPAAWPVYSNSSTTTPSLLKIVTLSFLPKPNVKSLLISNV